MCQPMNRLSIGNDSNSDSCTDRHIGKRRAYAMITKSILCVCAGIHVSIYSFFAVEKSTELL